MVRMTGVELKLTDQHRTTIARLPSGTNDMKTLASKSKADIPDCRQRRYFFYLSGCELPDSYLTYEIATDKLTLFIPPVEPDEVIWSGLPMSTEQAKAKYD